MMTTGPALRHALQELRRGVDAYSLGVSTLSAIAAAFVLCWITGAPLALTVLAVAALALFGVITALHAAMHAGFGWRRGRGLQAFAQGRYRDAITLLTVFERAAHYDRDRSARNALAAARVALDGSSPGAASG